MPEGNMLGLHVSVGVRFIPMPLAKGSQLGLQWQRQKKLWSLLPWWQVTLASWHFYFPIHKMQLTVLEGGLLTLEKTFERLPGGKE